MKAKALTVLWGRQAGWDVFIMLILTRRAGESLHIGDSIRITVFAIQGKQVKLGITVPAETVVLREELYLRIKSENKRALEADNTDLFAMAALWQSSKQE